MPSKTLFIKQADSVRRGFITVSWYKNFRAKDIGEINELDFDNFCSVENMFGKLRPGKIGWLGNREHESTFGIQRMEEINETQILE